MYTLAVSQEGVQASEHGLYFLAELLEGCRSNEYVAFITLTKSLKVHPATQHGLYLQAGSCRRKADLSTTNVKKKPVIFSVNFCTSETQSEQSVAFVCVCVCVF